jgi:hypothetical protein
MARMDAKQPKADDNLREIRDGIKTGQEEIRSIVDAWIADMKRWREQNLGKLEANPVEMTSVAVHEELRMEDAVGSSGTEGKLRRKRHVAVWRGEEPGKLTRVHYGSRGN